MQQRIGQSPPGTRSERLFVGRERELRSLHTALDETVAGHGRVVWLAGEAGIGKTRTAATFAGAARQAGACVLWGGCYDGEWAPPFGPFAEAIAAYARACEPETLRADMGFGAAPLARVIPAVRERLSDVPEPAALQPDEERFRLLDAVSQFLIATATHTPVVVVLDDLHWADKGSIAMLRHVARFAPQHRLLILGTYRDAELDPQHPLTDALGALYRETTCERILLKGLDAAEVAQLVADSEVPSGQQEALASTLSAVTNGNPFFAREVLHHLIEEQQAARGSADGSPAVATIGIPDSVRQVLARRLRRLPSETGWLLTVGAACGGPFRLDVAARVASFDEATTLNAIDQSLRAQLIRPADSAECYDFAHALIRETLYSELSPSRQLRLHRELAEAMEHCCVDRGGAQAAELAYQYHRSASLPGAERGVEPALVAAARAEAAYAHDELATFLRMALDLLPPHDPRRPRLCARLGRALAWVLSFEEAVRIAGEAGRLLAESEGAAAAADYLGEVTVDLAVAGSQPSAWTVARQGMQYIGHRRDLTWLRLASYDLLRREQEDPAYPGMPLDGPERRELAALWASLPDENERGVLLTAVLLPIASRDEALRERARDPVYRSFWAGDLRGALPAFEQLATQCEHEGRINHAAIVFTLVARCRLALGDVAGAAAACARGVALSARIPEGGAAHVYLTGYRFDHCTVVDDGWAELLSSTGNSAAGLAVENLSTRASILAAGAVLLAQLGRVEPALSLLATSPVPLDRAPAWAGNYTAMACDVVTALWLLDRTDHIECFERNLREKVIAPDFRYPMRDGRLSLARVCALQRRYQEAAEWFAKARVILDEQGARPLRAIADHDEALMYLRRAEAGDAERAAPLLEVALRQFRTIGMSGWIRRAESLLRDGKEFTPEPPADAAAEPAPPTPLRAPNAGTPVEVQPRPAVFLKEGDYWTLGYGRRSVRLKHSRGMSFLARLLRQPGREIASTELVAALADTGASPAEPATSVRGSLGDAGEVLDATARRAYKRRLDELRAELEEAEQFNDSGRAERLRSEQDMLATEVTRAIGLGGRVQRAGSHSERARVNVTRAVALALRKIAAEHPQLGEHFARTIHTGTLCSYAPDPLATIAWMTDGG